MDSKPLSDHEAIGLLMRVPLRLSVEIGGCGMSVADVLKLGIGSIVELDRTVNQPVDLLVNDRAIARGEIVAVEEAFALRITELLGL